MEAVVMWAQLEKTYSGKRIFLTGHTGFKGMWLLMILRQLGAEVMGYALAPDEEKHLFGLAEGDKLCTSVIADIRDGERLRKEMLDFQPDFVFHLAAQALVRKSYAEPIATFDTNVMGTAHVLDALRFLKKPCTVVVVTTDKVYENREWWYPYREVDALGGYDPYSASKAAAEIAAASYRSSFFHPEAYNSHHKAVATARAGNVIGGGDWSVDRIIPDLIRALEAGESLKVRNPQAVRPWQHVLEPLGGYLLLGAKLAESPQDYAQAYNFGPYPEDTLPVQALVEMALERWGSGTYTTPSGPEKQPHEAKLLKLDISKAWHELGWKPRLNASKTLAMTLDWYRNYEEEGARELVERQIEEYYSDKSTL